MIERIVFDYGRTLFDRETDDFFPEVASTLEYLSKSYSLSIVSYSKPEEVQTRINSLKNSDLWSLFQGVWFVDQPEAKHDALDELLSTYKLSADRIAVVDDYVIRGVAWANSRGAISVWFKNGKFSKILPNPLTGEPAIVVTNFGELKNHF